MTSNTVIVDTGPIVALLNKREQHHGWAREQFNLIKPPAITCEAVVSEACFLLQGVDGGIHAVMKLLDRGVIGTSFTLKEELAPTSTLLRRYTSTPMSFADACLVRMAEQYDGSKVLTLDSDFRIYRKNGRQVIPVIMPA